MNTALKLSFVSLMLLMAGCAQMVTKTYQPVRGGTVKYNTGWFMAEKNRNKALAEMKQYCGRQKAQILSEDTREELTGNTSSSARTNGNETYTNTTAGKEGNIYMHFKCVSGKKLARK